ncbi:2-oxo acid dehydrogenase subunit E2, partial [Streptomyces cacaoi]
MTESVRSAERIREFKMPDVGEGLTEAEILKWYVQPGDTVSDGQVVCEVETAKAAVELPIPFDGAVHELRFAEGTTVDVGTPIITVDTAPSAGAPPAPEAPAEQPATAEPAGEAAEGAEGGEPQGRQPVLVGYGVSAGSTRRRPRKRPEEQQAPESAGGAADTGSAGAPAAAREREPAV